MRLFKKIINICVVILVACVGISNPSLLETTWGFDFNLYQKAVSEGDYDSRNPLVWMQGGAIPPKQSEKSFQTEEGTYTYGQAGCTYISHYMMMVRAGLKDPEKDGTFVDFMDDFIGKNKEGLLRDAGGFFPTSGTITKYFPKIHCVDMKMNNTQGGSYMTPILSMNELSKLAKEAYGRGNFVVAYLRVATGQGTAGEGGGATNGHAIFIEGVDSNGDLITCDASNDGKFVKNSPMFKNYTGGDMDAKICYFYVEYQIDGVKSMDTLTLWERFGDGKMGSFVNTEENTDNHVLKEQTQLVYKAAEEEIEGFTKEDLLAVSQIAIQTEPVVLEGMEQARLNQLQKNIKDDQFDLGGFLNLCVTLLGFGFCIYGVLLTLIMCLDYLVNKTNHQLVTLFTFNKLYVIMRSEEKPLNHKYHYVTYGKVVLISMGMIFLGITMMTGTLYTIIETIVNWVLGLW